MSVTIEVYPRLGKKYKDAVWLLSFMGDRARLRDDRDEIVDEWRGREVLDCFTFPSFLESRKYLTLTVEDHSDDPDVKGSTRTIDFEFDKRDLQKVKDFHDRVYVLIHPDAVKKKMLTALGLIVGGIILVTISILLNLNADRSGSRIRTSGLVIGPILAIAGIVKLFELPRWNRMVREIHADRDGEDDARRQDDDESRRSRDED